mmetsp:Transcript_76739/g.194758  ORF Transcript_76739/g.194758 Transcript_76739/m.194758 type:complete len:295 (-) Transcript_76739:47-931(-)
MIEAIEVRQRRAVAQGQRMHRGHDDDGSAGWGRLARLGREGVAHLKEHLQLRVQALAGVLALRHFLPNGCGEVQRSVERRRLPAIILTSPLLRESIPQQLQPSLRVGFRRQGLGLGPGIRGCGLAGQRGWQNHAWPPAGSSTLTSTLEASSHSGPRHGSARQTWRCDEHRSSLAVALAPFAAFVERAPPRRRCKSRLLVSDLADQPRQSIRDICGRRCERSSCGGCRVVRGRGTIASALEKAQRGRQWSRSLRGHRSDLRGPAIRSRGSWRRRETSGQKGHSRLGNRLVHGGAA